MRSSKFLLGYIVLVLMVSSYLSVNFANTPSSEVLQINHGEDRAIVAYTPHAPVIITSDADFETQSWPGNGSIGDPYVISGLNISSTDVCIDIQNTRAHFKVINCIISSPSSSSEAGIYFENVTNGVVRDCMIDSHIYGMYLREMVDCEFINNTAASNGQLGFVVYFADMCTFVNNTATEGTETGFHIGDSGNCSLVNNTATDFYRGFRIHITRNISLIDNTAMHNDQWGFIIETNADNTTMINNRAMNSVAGVELDNADNCTLIGNTLEDNSYAGIVLSHAHNNTLLDNTVQSNTRGIRLYYSYDCTVYYNTMISNGVNAEDEGGVNSVWDDGIDTGNTWDDYDGSGNYTIPGGAGSVDRYPILYDLVLPIIDSPEDVSYVEGSTANNITWTPTDANPSSYIVKRDGIVLTSTSWDGSQVIVDIDGLAVGTYTYTLEVEDLGRNTATDSVTVTVTAEPTTSTTPTSPTAPDGSLMTMIVIGISGAVVVIVIFVVMKKRGG